MRDEIEKILNKYKTKMDGGWANQIDAINLTKNKNPLINELIILFNTQLASSEAKVYSYEKIIANSNFKAVLEKTKKKTEN